MTFFYLKKYLSLNKNTTTTNHHRIGLNPHVETHGMYSIEWSYHFPLRRGFCIESELEVSFPEEKVPGAARASLATSNLNITRLSFADSAAEVRRHSIRFYRDTLSYSEVLKHLELTPHKDALARQSKWATLIFIQSASHYWNTSFFSRAGMFLQSDLKQNSKNIKGALQHYDAQKNFDWQKYYQTKKQLVSSLRASLRIIKSSLVWERISESEELKNAFLQLTPTADFSSGKMLSQLKDLCEFSLMLMGTCLAEAQGAFLRCQKLTEEHLTVSLRHHSSDEDFLQNQQRIITEAKENCRRIQQEQFWLSHWTKTIMEYRASVNLPSLADVSSDPQAASRYHERLRELKRLHYQAWDLSLDLRQNEKRFNFVGGFAAAFVSALFALLATNLWFFFYTRGKSATEIGTVAFTSFAFANVIIYVLKDSLKNWLKDNVLKILRLRTDRWVGKCMLRNSQTAPLKIADVERETWWTDQTTNALFHVWEKFDILPDAQSLDAKIIKQSWRLPLDEILHSLDSTSHTLRLPGLDGVPQEMRVYKRHVFPYKLSVTVKDLSGKKPLIVDHAMIQGKVVTSGDQIEFLD